MSKNEKSIFNNNFCFSRVLKDIDFLIKFHDYKEEKSLYILRELQRKEREKRILFNRRKNHSEIVNNLKKANEEREMLLSYKESRLSNNNNLSQINLYSANNNNYLPKIQNKEEQKNKENRIVIFEKLWKENLNKDKKAQEKKNINNKTTIYNSNYIMDIFDENYIKMKKIKEKKTEQKILLEKIKINNLKVKNKLKIHQNLMEKFKDKREYSPNYNAIEKHMPQVNFNTKSQRIFPIKFIKINNNRELNPQPKRNEAVKILRKNNSSHFLNNNISTCTLFKNYLNSKDNNSISDKKSLIGSTSQIDRDNSNF